MQRKAMVKAKKRTGRKARKIIRAAPQQSHASGYDEALLMGIIDNRSKQRVSAHALEFSSLLSSLTPGMREMQHKSGFRIGRAIYRIYERNKRYIWYEESVADLVSFLEASGLGSVAYNIFPDTVSIRIYNRKAPHLGIATHEFEAGVISGFASTGRRQLTEIHETMCSRSGAQHCEFMRADRPQATDISEEYAIAKLIESSAGALKNGLHNATIPMEYYMLASATLFMGGYSHALKNIASYIGNEFASALHLTGNKQSVARAEALTRLLNLGVLTIKSLKPVNIGISFDGLSSRREHVELSLAFINGLLNRLITDRSRIETTGSRSVNGYRIMLVEKKQV